MNATPRTTSRSEVGGLFDRWALPTAFGLGRAIVDAGANAPGAGAERARNPDCRRRLAARCGVLTMLQAASMLLAAGAQAQADPCEQLKGVLAARIDASGVRGYTLETVPGGSPVPTDAKVIGTCQGGASKILYRRWGATRASSSAAGAAAPASAPQAIAVRAQQAQRSPGVQGDRALPPVPASAPSPTPRPVSRSNEAASALPTPAHAPENRLVGRASEVEAVRAIDRAVAQPAQPQLDKTIEVKVPLSRQASEFMAENWRWLCALLLLPVAGWIWLWRAHRSAYDEAGLPRGPKL